MRSSYMWTAQVFDCVLRARVSVGEGHGVDLSRFPQCVFGGEGCIHMRLHLPDGILRLDLFGDAEIKGAIMVEPIIDLQRPIEPQIATVRRMAGLFGDDLVAVGDQRLIRLVEALRTADALAAGASLREIGLGVFGDDWPGDGEYLKSKVRRRVELANALLRTGARGVLARRV